MEVSFGVGDTPNHSSHWTSFLCSLKLMVTWGSPDFKKAPSVDSVGSLRAEILEVSQGARSAVEIWEEDTNDDEVDMENYKEDAPDYGANRAESALAITMTQILHVWNMYPHLGHLLG